MVLNEGDTTLNGVNQVDEAEPMLHPAIDQVMHYLSAPQRAAVKRHIGMLAGEDGTVPLADVQRILGEIDPILEAEAISRLNHFEEVARKAIILASNRDAPDPNSGTSI